ncbi:ABC transporter permease [Georgenia phoenicis]|uniref:ABC transporter permease n=1 Tax=unclassified Georgenia TaxID=2626815 RepID=UPI0039B0DC4A
MSTAAAPTRATGAARLAWAASDTWVVARRHLARLTRRPDELLSTILIPVMAVVMFGVVFGDALGAAMGTPDAEYRQFLMPGVFALAMAFGIGSTTIAVASDAQDGVLDRMRTLPASPVALLAGRALADVLTAVAELAVLVSLGAALGWEWRSSPGAVLAALGVLLLLRLAFSWVGILLGLMVSGPEAAMKYFALVFPLAMVADTIVPTALMPEWLAGPAAWNPLSLTTAATRELVQGLSGPPSAADAVTLAVIWPVAVTAVCVPLALALLRRLGR